MQFILIIHISSPSWEKAVATHSSTLAWKIPQTEEPGRLQSVGLQRVRHNWATSLSLFTFMHWRRKWQPTPVFLPRESQGQQSLVGCHLWGRRVRHNWSDAAAAASPSWTSFSTPHLSHHRAPYWAPCVIEQLLTGFYFTDGSVYMSMLLSPPVPLSPSLTVSTGSFSVSVSSFLPRRCSSVPSF